MFRTTGYMLVFALMAYNLQFEIVVATGKEASERVAEKVGAVREGVLRNRYMVQGKVHDAVTFSLIPQDFS